MAGVSKGCMSSCWPNPCQNGGVCQENWVSYTCRCANSWAHIGENCEIDINKDHVTFSGLSGSSLLFDLTDEQPHALSATIVLSFRTLLTEALLIYMHNHLGNFVQLELTDKHTVVISYNNMNQIVRKAVRTDDPLNDGKWKQVVAENYYNFTRLIVDGQSKVIEVRRDHFQTFMRNPFNGSFDQQTVFIRRTSNPFIHAYVGGIKDGDTTTNFLSGCIRGLRVGDYVFRLQDNAKSFQNDTLITPACNKGCQKLTCNNNGVCVEKWGYGHFKCNFDQTGFSGRRCEIEPSVLVRGNTVVRHSFQLPLQERYSLSERLSFRFKADPRQSEAKNKQIVLVYITSTKDKDYIIIKFDTAGNFVLETNQGDGIYPIKVRGQFEDGQPHDFSYVRVGSRMNLELDSRTEVSFNYPDYPLNNIDTIFIGGYIRDALNFLDVANFSGCISNTAFVPKDGSSRTLHTLRDLHIEEKGVTVFGDQTIGCSTAKEDKTTTQAPPVAAHITPGTYMESSMPPWIDGALHIVTLSAVPKGKQVISSSPLTPASTSVKGLDNDTYPVLFNTSDEPVGDISIIIAVIVVALLLVGSLCLILVLVRMRKHRGDYLGKKSGDELNGNAKQEADMELRQPLHNHHTSLGTLSGSSRNSPAPISSSGGPHTATQRRIIHPPTVPSDHLAKLDEFSMISVALGPRVPKPDVHPPEEARKRYEEGYYNVHSNLADGETECIGPIYSVRKQRPASSISEVLEEMERRQTPLTNDTPERPVRLHGEGELEWDSQADASAPLRTEEHALMNLPLLPTIPDDREESRLSSFSGHPSSSLGGDSFYQKYSGPLECSGSPAWSSHMNSTAECNGDSGYEAESRREATEDDITPEMADEIADINFHSDHPPKLYSFMVPDLRVNQFADPHFCDSHSPAGIFRDHSHGGNFINNSPEGEISYENSFRRDPFKSSNSSGFHMEESPDLSCMSANDRLLQEGTEV
ncbi:contactin associated protein-like 5-1 [Plakobranchus ocellatus]|uniref:Contactin associated protein-like 5-1 n=1 Tax=Plakobranchus ocellatus TaxID=259542 RepID=A0AAV4BJF8_9GAST|nr:contactin associated protein-like 5-1 [Plakobranchus ocellatus]